MYTSYGLTKSFLTFTRHCSVYIRGQIGTVSRQFVVYSRAVNKHQSSSRRFTTCAPAYVKSVHKFGRKIREALISKERSKMSGDSSQVLAPLQAVVKEKVRFGSAKKLMLRFDCYFSI